MCGYKLIDLPVNGIFSILSSAHKSNDFCLIQNYTTNKEGHEMLRFKKPNNGDAKVLNMMETKKLTRRKKSADKPKRVKNIKEHN